MCSRFDDLSYRNTCSEKTLQSNKKGFFLDFADFVVEEAGEQWIKNSFGGLTTDKDRIRCIYTSKETGDLVHNFLSNVQEVYRRKNSETSDQKRQEAEVLLKKNEAKKALVLFSQSVLRAPNTALAPSLWGRSKALMKLGMFSYALTDIQQALKSLSSSHKGEAFWNMGLCHSALGDEAKAKVAFGVAEKLLQDPEKERLLKMSKTANLKHKEERHPETPKISYSRTIPNASGKLSIKSSPTMGRYIVANQKISTGETLVVEPPYAACLLPEMYGTHCHHCFKPLQSPYGCPDCISVAFCSIECRDQALDTYHQYECKFLDLLIGSGMSILGHTSLRMITQNPIQTTLETYRSSHKSKDLCTNAHLRSANDFLQRTLMAAFLLRILQRSGYFGQNNTDDEYRIGEMLLFNLQMLQFNAHEIYETWHSPESRIRGSKSKYIGVAVYLTASLFNHDCHPALARHFIGKDIVLTATRPIKPHEVVPENYGPIFTRRNLAERKRSLSSRYWFDCQCLACQQQWPSIGGGLEEVSKRLRCPNELCTQTFTLPLAKLEVDCPRCKSTVDFSEASRQLQKCEDAYMEAFELMDKDQSGTAIGVLTVAIDTFYRLYLPPHKETHLAEEMLRVCLADSGNTWAVLVKKT